MSSSVKAPSTTSASATTSAFAPPPANVSSLTDLAAERVAQMLNSLDRESADEAAQALSSHPADVIGKICEKLPWEGLFSLWCRFELSFAPHISAALLDAAMARKELFFRQTFAVDRANRLLDRPHLMLVDVFAHARLFKLGQWGTSVRAAPDAAAWPLPIEPAPPLILESSLARSRRAADSERATGSVARVSPPSAVTARDAFVANWRCFTDGALDDLDWSNVFCAGGAPLACATPHPKEEAGDGASLTEDERRAWLSADVAWALGGHARGPYAKGGDVDLFLYGLDAAGANAKLEAIHAALRARSPSPVLAVRSGHAVTFVRGFPRRHVQVVLRIFKSPAEVLIGFDLDAACIGYDGARLWALPRNLRALNTRSNLADVTRRSLTYESRLFKYSKRGFAVAVPELRRDAIDPALYDLPLACKERWKRATGLRRLLLLEHVRDRGECHRCGQSLDRCPYLNQKRASKPPSCTMRDIALHKPPNGWYPWISNPGAAPQPWGRSEEHDLEVRARARTAMDGVR